MRDLIGMEVFSDEGQRLGPVTDVIQNTAQEIFEIGMADGRKVLIPKVDSYVLEIDGENRRITVHLQEGILDL